MATDYNSLINEDLNEIDAYHVTAGEQSLISARVSYTFNLLGPSMTISTGCSSAMTCIHLGVQAIKNGNCYYDYAILLKVDCCNIISILAQMDKSVAMLLHCVVTVLSNWHEH